MAAQRRHGPARRQLGAADCPPSPPWRQAGEGLGVGFVERLMGLQVVDADEDAMLDVDYESGAEAA